MPRWRILLMVISIVLDGSVIGCFLFRDRLLLMAFHQVQTRMQQTSRAHLTASSVSFSGFIKVKVEGLALQTDGADTLLCIREAEAGISLLNLCRAKIVVNRVKVTGAVFNINNEPGRNNYSFLRSKRSKNAGDSTVKAPLGGLGAGYRAMASGWEAKLFRVLNTTISAKDVWIHYKDSANTESVYIPAFSYDLHKWSGLAVNEKMGDTISITGQEVRWKEAYLCTISHSGCDTACLPFLDRDHGLHMRFHSLTAALGFDNKGDACRVTADASLSNFHINHWRLAKEDIILPAAQIKWTLKFSDDAVELDSASTLRLGNASCHLFMRYGLKPDTTIMFALHMAETPADSFFQALPLGMFNTLRGISCTGTLAYDLTFALHTNEPDSLLFYSGMKQKGLQIRHFGADSYTRINGPFTFDAYEKDHLVRRLAVGPENPYYTTLSQMPSFVPQAVLQAEDPSFMQHRGFYMDAFRESIAKNYKERRFARGGSTISMQLVKNVYLSRDKTISRKAEEALIVYLIEYLGLVPKERMLEVYLNVIEWGPNVYGIGEAARFYFNKRPAQLTLQESIFLASLIPRPKSFQYEFDTDGQLRSSMSGYFKILSTRMVWRGVLPASDTVGLLPRVTLKGPARLMVQPKDSTGNQTKMEEPE